MSLDHQNVIPPVSTLVEVLNHRGQHSSEKMAFAFLADGEAIDSSLTYGELNKKSQALGQLLCKKCSPGDRAALAYPPGLDFIVAFFACLRAGVVAVPVHLPGRNQSIDRWKNILVSSQAKLALTTSGGLAKNSRLNLNEGSESPLEIEWMATDVPFPIVSEEVGFPEITPQTLAFLQYTSGSTGTPKGVIVTHQNLMENAALIQEGFKLSSNSKALSWLPAYHDMGLIGGIIQPLCLGVTMLHMSPLLFLQRPLRWLQAISRYRIGTSGAPNFAYDLCTKKITHQQRQMLDLSCWELAFVGAEKIRAETLDNFVKTFGPCGFSSKALYPCYGLAEATLFVAGGEKNSPTALFQANKAALQNHQVLLEQDPEQAITLVGHGQGHLGQNILIVDPKTGEECSVDRVGEIRVSGPNVSQGYWQSPQESHNTFEQHIATGEGPFLCTGDLGFIHNGELFLTGRLKELMIIRGRNHYPQDIEHTVQQCDPALLSGGGASFSIELDEEEHLVVIQEVERSYLRKLDTGQIVRQIRRAVNVEHGIQVSEIVLVRPGSILRTSSGKVRRSACRDAFSEGHFKAIK